MQYTVLPLAIMIASSLQLMALSEHVIHSASELPDGLLDEATRSAVPVPYALLALRSSLLIILQGTGARRHGLQNPFGQPHARLLCMIRADEMGRWQGGQHPDAPVCAQWAETGECTLLARERQCPGICGPVDDGWPSRVSQHSC